MGAKICNLFHFVAICCVKMAHISRSFQEEDEEEQEVNRNEYV